MVSTVSQYMKHTRIQLSQTKLEESQSKIHKLLETNSFQIRSKIQLRCSFFHQIFRYRMTCVPENLSVKV